MVDICAPRLKLIIEIDGSQHLDHEMLDRERSNYLESKGYRILRYWNNEVMFHIDQVVTVIEQELDY